MKRLALSLALGSLLLSTQIVGCGGSDNSGKTATGPVVTVPASEDPNLPAEVRAQAKIEEDRLQKAVAKEAKTSKPAAP